MPAPSSFVGPTLAEAATLAHTPMLSAGASGREAELSKDDSARFTELVRCHFASIWRTLRRLGLSTADADDAAQQVFVIAARRIREIEPARARSFLMQTSVYVAAKLRRYRERRREDFEHELEEQPNSELGLDDLVERRRVRALLDQILSEMPHDLRVVFVLFEIEQCTTGEIAEMLEIPRGTVASRLRRAREEFQARAQQIDNQRGGAQR